MKLIITGGSGFIGTNAVGTHQDGGILRRCPEGSGDKVPYDILPPEEYDYRQCHPAWQYL